MQVARTFLDSLRHDGPWTSTVPALRARSFEDLYRNGVEVALAELRRLLGDATLQSFVSWAKRHLVEVNQYSVLDAWCTLFPRLVHVEDALWARSDLRPERLHVLESVQSHFNPEARWRLRCRLREGRRLPRSSDEYAYEEMYPYYRLGWGALGHAADSVGREWARQTWADLEERLSPRVTPSLVQLGREVAAASGLWEEFTALRIQMAVSASYPCPCCGYLTFHKRPPGTSSTFDDCPVCGWEDDAYQFRNTDDSDGANEVSLEECRANFRAFGAKAARFKDIVRPPLATEGPNG